MNFGMAYWHQDFADIWIAACKDDPDITSGFEIDEYPKKEFSELPKITFSNQEAAIDERLKSRVQELMTDLFEESAFTNSINSVSIDYYSLQRYLGISAYVVCFASKSLYASKATGIGHRQNSVHYQSPPINPDLRSTAYLQTLPRNEPIVLYSHSGLLSAFAVAYLRLLGYNAKTMSFGMHNFYYSTLLSVEEFESYVFTTTKIMNYPYETGE
jgi:rhodanese-related sulfurtransferase